MADERDEIRSRIDLVELVGQKVALRRAGKNWKGLCPFHDDRNPSFYVSPEIGYYRCWSCGEKGDAFTWVMKTQNMEFREALELLAKQAGVTLRSHPGEASKGENEARAAAMEEALRFFRQELSKSNSAKSYCAGRSLGPDVIEKWELGYAPDLGEALAVHLQRKGHNLKLCQALFLVDQDAGGGFFDRFRGRLMFPIRDERGHLVAFGGRLLGDGHPKYVNSGDTPIYRKSRVLYGLQHAKTKLLSTRKAVLVEGYLDVIACHRAGVDEAVASLGTSLADDHGRLLKRWCDRATVLYDADEAGMKAAERACEILRLAGIEATVALAPPGDDPDTLLAREGPAAVQRAAAGGVSPLAFALRRLEARSDPAQAEFWNEAASALAACDSPAEVDRHVSDLASRFMKGQTESGARSTLYAMIRNQRRVQRKSGVSAVVRMPVSDLPMALPEAAVFRALLDEDLRAEAFQALSEEGLFRSDTALNLRAALLETFPKGSPSGPAKEWIGAIADEELRGLLADIQFFARHQAGGKLVEDLATSESLRESLAILRRQREESRVASLSKETPTDPVLESIMERLGNVKGWRRYEEGSEPVR